MSPFDLAGLKGKLQEIDRETEKSGFWDDPEKAQDLLKKKKSLETKIEKYESLETGLSDIEELIPLAEGQSSLQVRDQREITAQSL